MRKLLLVFLFTFLFIPMVVIGDNDLNDTVPTSTSEIETARQAISDYCDSNKKVSGCLYVDNKSKFNELGSGFVMDSSSMGQTFSITNDPYAKLLRGYQAFDGKGNAIFAGCYRFEKNGGTYFAFKIYSGNSCQDSRLAIVPAKGTSYEYWTDYSYSPETVTYSGQYGLGWGQASYTDWVAKQNGDCPLVFGYTANSKWWTSSTQRYMFSNTLDSFTNGQRIYTFKSDEKYVVNPGCTVEDIGGKEKAQELLDRVLNKIKSDTCPEKIEDMNSYQDNLEKWYSDLRKNNEYRVLWSAGLIDEVTKKSAEVQISEAIHAKISECQYTICNVDSSKRTIIESNLGAACKNGCTLSNVKTPSDSENAKCYCCGGSQGCTYQWMEEGGSSCSLQSSISKDQCIGTTKDLECRRCLVNAYEKAELTDEQKSCMAGSEIAKLLTTSNIDKENEDAATKDVEKEIEENRELRQKIYDKMDGNIRFDFEIPSGDLGTCRELLGQNLTAIVKMSITILQIVGAIIAVVKGMMSLIPSIIAKDADALKKASSTLQKMAIILVIIFLFKPLLNFLGTILGFDISCLV